MLNVSNTGHRLSYAKDTVIYSEGEQASNWYEIASGLVRTCRYLPNGNRQVTGFFADGQVFGVEHTAYRATAEAVTDITIVRRSRNLLDGEPAVTSASAHPLRLALQSAEDRIQLLVLKGAPARLAGFLLAAAVEEPPGTHIAHLPMRRADIADYLAIDVATVSRTLTRFVGRRLLTPLRDHRFRIADIDYFKSIVNGDSSGFAEPPVDNAGVRGLSVTPALRETARAMRPHNEAAPRPSQFRAEPRWGLK
jgi:CRP/FNR family transcriptional regulator, nitrogen fixation regulation protein